ncbi:MAG: DUF3330 domain-containing protein [Candidatus Berkiella sp.]
MSNKNKKSNNLLYQCDCCYKEVPKTAIVTFESVDYDIRHFCSIECYEQWWSENRKINDGKNVT